MAAPDLAALATNVEGYAEAKRLLRQRKKAKASSDNNEASDNAVKALFAAIKAWEELGENDAELVRDYLLKSDFIDRLTTLLERDN